MKFKTEQESFWSGEFGDAYIARNKSDQLLATNLAFFSKALASANQPSSCVEFGANIGMNLQALRQLFPRQELAAVEINPTAVTELRKLLPYDQVFHSSILDFQPSRLWDLVLIKGVLIHVNPDYLPLVYDKLFASCSRYLLVCEYYSPTPVALSYRGHTERLFKRDFAGELLDRYSELRLLDYGFIYHRDHNFPADDMTWFLLEKEI